ncbi:MAG: NAD-dependent epimerase/dehydratase family protein [Bacteroidales bacterium]|nr:NAD-dependent epimerase/dehydratase family protein [Bacteroidales bacterium]
MKIFVSGSTGSIGAHLVKMLAERGDTIHVLVRSLSKARNLTFDNIIPFKGDILDKTSIDRAMKGCRQVYHVAAFAKVWARETRKFYDVNVRGTVNVLQSAVDYNVEKVVVTSTAGVLGPSINGVITEDKIRDIDIFNEYEGSKAMAESRIKDFVNIHNLNVVIVSPTRVYGPFVFGKPSSTTLLIDKYVNDSWSIYPGSGKEIGNYVYIEDVAIGHLLAMEKGRKGHTYLLGGENYDYVTFYKKLGKVSGIKRKMYKVPLWTQIIFAGFQLFRAKRFGKEPVITPKWIAKGRYNWELSPEKAIHELGLPVTPFEEGLKKTIEYLRSYRNKV